MPFWKWSHTASANATADSTIDWAEGMAPSAVNDSARAMMARTAEWRDDISGTLTTGGTSTAYTVASNQGFDSLPDMSGVMVAFIPNAANGGACTLDVDGLGAKPLRFGPGLDLPSGTLITGTPYVATYNNTNGEWYLQNSMNPYGMPLGGLMPYIGSSAPSSAFALPYGQAISRTTYAALFGLIGTTYGSGDGSTTFNIPDLRGRVTAFLDNMGGSAAGRIGTALATDGGTIDGQALGSVGGSSTHVQATGEMAQHNHSVSDPGHTHSTAYTGALATGNTNNGGTLNVPAGSAAVIGINSATTGISLANAGSGAAMAWIQPTIMLNCILRII